MKLIKNLQDITQLGLTSEIEQALIHNLTEPFDFDIEATQAIWNEINTSLYYIEPSDSDESLSKESEADQSMLRFVKNYPEFVDVVVGNLSTVDDDKDHLLALAIFGSDGGGCYVFAPKLSQTHIVNELKTHLEK
ncbi:hypothetical protein IHC87_13040 [Photobacterium damselae subsp. damselae]|uniref:hypothetical protein n=1 Tax=Photobacterium damselae TaxID=38293 RepID=UPI001F20FA19|nr:hypothetical protein [Photobacterium damselae]UJZ93546.1 hypothetical protein IHC87_13040 [Photobacterium damselae subsp. damselae]UJZ97527.1 hypothetical protein IHC88_13010 [Photobacterium damselae subsp. damselae]